MKNLTTKILTIGLTATLFAGCLTACKTTTKGINMAVSSKLEQNEAGEANKELTGPQVTVGGWSVPASHEVTEEHKKIYKDACSKYDGTGSSHEPVALLATQLVAGTNYCFYCQSTVKSSKGPLSPVIVYINVNPSGEADFINTDRDFFYDNKGEVVPGGWENAADPSITEDIKKIMSKATETITGEEYEPVAYIASQVVAGKNHAILCKATPSTKGLSNEAKYVILTIYENLDGKCEITKTTDVSIGIK